MNTKSRIKKSVVVEGLTEARERTRLLLRGVSEEDLRTQHDPIMSPLIWDYGHIGNYEELWLLQKAHGKTLSKRELYDMYNASLYPREERPSLNLLDRRDADMYLDAVREAVLETLEEADFSGDDPLLKDGFVYTMIIQHEAQHNETMLQTLQLKKGEGYKPQAHIELPKGKEAQQEQQMVAVPGGEFVMGTDEHAFTLDNERGAHHIDLPDFLLDKSPVTNRAYLEFVQDGGYQREEFWEPAGWEYIKEERINAPKHWYQADAYARWAGKRLPSEQEWEKAASWDPKTGTKRLYPWGEEPPTLARANLDQLAFGAAEVGSYSEGASAYGALGMLGEVWEWTATDLYAYPGFRAFPYPEYSEIFFGTEYKVLRGGSWATRPAAIRNTFRNWDFPVRRQLFCGFRCAKDA